MFLYQQTYFSRQRFDNLLLLQLDKFFNLRLNYPKHTLNSVKISESKKRVKSV
jgi:hypothetical protein